MSKFDFKVLSYLKEGRRCHYKEYKLGGEIKEKVVFIPINWEGVVERYEDQSGVLKIQMDGWNISFSFKDDKELKSIIEQLS